MDEKFEEVVGRYLEKAIEVETETSMSQASSSMLFATACYNAQNILDKSSPNNLKALILQSILKCMRICLATLLSTTPANKHITSE